MESNVNDEWQKESRLEIRSMTQEDLPAVLLLYDEEFGSNWVTLPDLYQYLEMSTKNHFVSTVVAIIDSPISTRKIIGFKTVFAAGKWDTQSPHLKTTPEKLSFPLSKYSYSKSTIVAATLQGHGIGSQLHKAVVEIAKKQGSLGMISHVWTRNDSAMKFAKKMGIKEITFHPKMWLEISKEHGYNCKYCEGPCACDALEGEYIL